MQSKYTIGKTSRLFNSISQQVLAVFIGFALTLSTAHADWNMTVTTTTDELTSTGTDCSLREAITNFQNGNATTYPECGTYDATGNVIINVPAGTHALNNSGSSYIGISASRNLTIQGTNASTTIIDRGASSSVRVFQIGGSVVLTLSNLTLKGGVDPAGGAGGGAIYNDSSGTLTINNCTFLNNSAPNGGAIYNKSGRTTVINNSTFSGNSATTKGGAIYNENLGTVTINNSTLSGNLAATTGGIYSIGTLHLSGNTINSNTNGDCYSTVAQACFQPISASFLDVSKPTQFFKEIDVR